ncbi:MAG: 2-amino-4-hydroxy-6-hydroxymethyldihydropteridine diphosphokinase [Syntrophales bacterium]|nr:2-amino-4-hydroxy-6-hydroxymethyldihydropteridine diphosphokinase [Syntrophales bacterium]
MANDDSEIAFIGIGSNLGDPLAQCEQAVSTIRRVEEIRCLAQSSWYLTAPVGGVPQNDFINGVLKVSTTLKPIELLNMLKIIERSFGERTAIKWGPRYMDLDILFYGRAIIEEKQLVIPHPECHRRRFVLEPLCEIEPGLVHPVFGLTVKELLDQLGETQRVQRLGSCAVC